MFIEHWSAMKIFKLLCVLLPLLPCIVANNFSFAMSIADMEVLLRDEKLLIESLNDYAGKLNLKLNVIKDTLKNLQHEHQRTLKNVHDPLSSSALAQRLQANWIQFLEYLNKPIGEDFVAKIGMLLEKSPSIKDLQAAAVGLHRIQVVYDLHIDDMAQGRLLKDLNGTKLSALDLNAIGMLVFRSGFLSSAVNWLESSLRVHFDNQLYLQVFRRSTKRFYYDYKAIALKTIKSFKNLTAIQAVSRGAYKRLKIESPSDPMSESLNLGLAMVTGQQSVRPVFNAFKRTCHGRKRIINSVNKLVCFYKNYVSFMKIAPIKVEVFSFEPLILLLLDVISNEDIVSLKKISKYHMEPAGTDNQTVSNARVAKVYSVDAPEGEFNQVRWRKSLQLRIGFDFSGFEVPQVINYGIGGHYCLHYDVLSDDMTKQTGNRLISMVFYLSDVEMGGATVFPMLDLAVFPRKGAALLWFNMRDDETLDYRVMHAACPVLKGSKWILTLWIHKFEAPHIKPEHFVSKDLISFSKNEMYKTLIFSQMLT